GFFRWRRASAFPRKKRVRSLFGWIRYNKIDPRRVDQGSRWTWGSPFMRWINRKISIWMESFHDHDLVIRFHLAKIKDFVGAIVQTQQRSIDFHQVTSRRSL